MKIRPITLNEFQPVEFALKLESLREVELMTALFNASLNNFTEFVNKNAEKSSKPFSEEEISGFKKERLWQQFNNIVNRYK